MGDSKRAGGRFPYVFPVTENKSGVRFSRVLKPASLLLFALVVVLVVFGIAWISGWRGGFSFLHNRANDKARIQSARLLLKSGQYAAVKAQLQPMLADSRDPYHRPAQLLQWHADWTQTMAIPVGSADYQEAFHDLSAELGGLLSEGGWSAGQLKIFASDAKRLGAFDLSAQASLAAAKEDPAGSRHDMESAASALVAGGKAVEAGKIRLAMAEQDRNPAWQRRDFMAGMKWVVSGGNPKFSLELGRTYLSRMPLLLGNLDVIQYMSKLAFAADQPRLAEKWLKAALEKRPMDVTS